ncbi:MAG: putative ATPases involved in pili biogenesis, PilB-like protein s [Candidatus Nomurabacteria bacterium GW2011_GWE1_32_28]|uniref:Putative ATPases involved in pili biogenesis, PilB-like protein s n=1 Tax=Candidatus Nomurabacteria bacterium GW2011_GWF1_31_48 TaxID=1618767 RepID=A0A0G0ATK0_9BACT|nr:MAG: putative ATPases involved in pili biogenesis, PilB-like protein s [Candidatus Nomurabacteria bacterium GW2011_GWF2_30_133]KKP28420.1 MAG: putative ATPases involved in pili biogenesis, PilB-like protein s [Candidatus Nomurabacteria bacterium GW2011_GWE2_31_40]KKP30000.1 MAG: putative ATPases involved in pili biogenesis, PilB-like protein s [Candidatus Nomurabacteria bacterium GW2011_GWF1_31_48]KKP34519.1 MAG: putative ATPases involved in pili biogenesis, PilB-like protein s [Candidatus No
MQINEKQLEKVILESGLVTRSVLNESIDKAKAKNQKLGNILLSDGKISETDLRRMEAFVLEIPFISLINKKIDFSILSLVPEPIARNHNIIAYNKSEIGLEVAMLDVDDLPMIDFIKKRSGERILPRITDTDSIKTALIQYRKSLQADFDNIIQKESASIDVDPYKKEFEKTEEELKALAEDLPIVKIVDSLIFHAILQNASDVHVEPGEKELVVRYRIDGILHDAMILDKNAAPGITTRIKVLANLKLDEKRLPQDGRFKIEQNGEKVSFRVSTLPTFYGEKTVIRILKENTHGFSLESLGFHGEGLERIHDSLKQRIGMVLATGPTGSGKTTTLYTMLDILNRPEVNISTVEDPIEYQIQRVNQTQVKPEIGLTFANGLRSLLRQDPDILMVGEIRDNETAGLAINASLTGHLVLSTIHTNSASGAIPRLIDIGVLPFLIISTVKTIIAQRLVRKLVDSKEKYFLSTNEIKNLGKLVDLDRMLLILKNEKIIGPEDEWKEVPFYKPVKNNESVDGYAGRIGIHEVLKVSSSIKELIIRGSSQDEIEEQAKKEGMITILEDGVFNAVLGQTSLEEVFRVVSE